MTATVPLYQDEELIITNQVGSTPFAITSMARRDKISQFVIPSSIIQMVNTQGSGFGSSIFLPAKLSFAPMTKMDAGAYSVIQNHSMLGNCSVFAGKRMKGNPNINVKGGIPSFIHNPKYKEAH